MSAYNRYSPSSIRYAPSQPDINILMMGETGTGKSTFINAFANYLVYNTLNEAIRGEMQVLIPSTFHLTDADTYDSRKISIGNPSNNEECGDAGQSSTQICKSYIFPIGNRSLRLIDAPGVGDVRGVDQDRQNCDHILAYISHYEHLNGICILLKPNHERLTVGFRFCFKEILTHLHINAKDNLMFIFTNGRATFYRPGSTATLLRSLLNDLYKTWKVEIPFNRENTFIFDNEAFRFLAIHKNGISFSKDEISNYSKSWDVSVEEFSRLMRYINKCELHAVRDSLSINEAQQLIRKLRRPIAEIARLIQENIQLAQKYKQDVLKNPSLALPKRLPQKNGKYIPFNYPRTVCTNGTCTQIIVVDGQRKMDYTTQCHPHCYLDKVTQECVGHPILQSCDAINKHTGLCKECNCRWDKHMHVTYEYEIYTTYVEINSTSQSSLKYIDERITNLRQEEASILEVCGKLSQFIKKNSITPYNDDILEYIQYFIREEEMKKSAGANNQDIIQGLKNMIEHYKHEQEIYSSVGNSKTTYIASNFSENDLKSEDIFDLVAKLYHLPINGASIRQQIEGLKENELRINTKREHSVQLPINANFSTVMQQLKEIICRN